MCFIFSYIISSFQPIGRLWGLHIDFTSTRTRTGWKQAFFNDHSGGFLQNRENINFPFSLLNIPVLRPRSNGVQYWLWIPERSFAKTRGRRNTRQTVSSSSFHNKMSWRHLTLWICWVLGGLGGLWGKCCPRAEKLQTREEWAQVGGKVMSIKGFNEYSGAEKI